MYSEYEIISEYAVCPDNLNPLVDGWIMGMEVSFGFIVKCAIP
jgi:hypothetical protein